MRIYITGIGGLIGSSVAEVAADAGHTVYGVDSNHRGKWFEGGSTLWRMHELRSQGIGAGLRDFRDSTYLVKDADLVVHCASQPSHDFSRQETIEDSAINYMGTVKLLEACRKEANPPMFAFLSTNKVYGDKINSLSFSQAKTRYRLRQRMRGVDSQGVNEDFSIDDSRHTPFGVSKTGADLMVQEYARCFGMKTVSLRCGCLTGPSGSAVEAQGFLGYLVSRAVRGETYRVYGHRGYQVRDNINARDVATAILTWAKDPKGLIYNMGGGLSNALSIREAVEYLKTEHGCDFDVEWDHPERMGDHIWWITDTSRFERDYPGWKRRFSVWETMDEMVRRERSRRGAEDGHEAVSAGPDEAAGVLHDTGGAPPEPARVTNVG